MSVDLRKIKKLIELLEESDLNEIEITEGENNIRLSRGGAAMPNMMQMPAAAPAPAVAASANTSEPKAATPSQEKPSTAEASVSGNTIYSPLVATYYGASSPDAADFVKVGDKVKVGDVLCILEAMKTFNQLESEYEGTVVAIHKSSGDPVEFGEPLFVIE